MSKFTIRRRRGGFTLIEIMIVVLIISVLLAIAIPNFMRARETSRAKSCSSTLRQIETAKQQWAMDEKMSGTDEPAMADLWGVDKYIKDQPLCPSTGADDYTVNPVDTYATCANGSGAAGTYDYHGLDTP